jgi:hypothetical protein
VVSRIRDRQIQPGPKSLEVGSQVLQTGIAVVQGYMFRELSLNERLKGGTHSGDDDLSRFGIEVATESLEVRAQQHDVSTQILFNEPGIRRSDRLRRGTLQIDLVQAE